MKTDQLIGVFGIIAAVIASVTGANVDDTIVCKTQGVFLVKHPKICRQYYICINGVADLQVCAAGNHYSPNDGYCIPEVSSTCTDTINVGLCPSNAYGLVEFMPYPPDCSKYLICNKGEAVLVECAAGLLFDPIRKYCGIASSVDCTGNTVSNPLPSGVTCPRVGVAELAHPYDCTHFFLCVDGDVYEYECTKDLYYDVKTGRCNLKTVSKCFTLA